MLRAYPKPELSEIEGVEAYAFWQDLRVRGRLLSRGSLLSNWDFFLNGLICQGIPTMKRYRNWLVLLRLEGILMQAGSFTVMHRMKILRWAYEKEIGLAPPTLVLSGPSIAIPLMILPLFP